MFTPHGGNSFGVKKLSESFAVVVLAVLERRVVGRGDGHRDPLRQHLALQAGEDTALIAIAASPGESPRQGLSAVGRPLRDHLPRAVLGLRRHGDGLVPGLDERAQGAGRAALHHHRVERVVLGERLGDGPAGLLVVPAADDLDDLVALALGAQHGAEALVAIALRRVALEAAHLEHLALAAELLVDELAPLGAPWPTGPRSPRRPCRCRSRRRTARGQHVVLVGEAR